MDKIVEKFKEISDPRHSGYIKHKLCHILTIIMLGVMCGLDTLDDIFTFAESKKEYLSRDLGIETTPSKATFCRILNIIDGNEVGRIMYEVLRESLGIVGDVVAVDGKTIRSTAKEGEPHSALQILTAYVTESRVILGQEAIHKKTNEIPVFQQMLDYLDISDKIITADALHCQRDTCAKIVRKGGDYLIGLKNNQPSLYEDVSLYFSSPETKNDVEIHKTIEKNAGRLEIRICRKMNDISWLAERHNWPGLQCVFSIERTVICRGKTSHEISFYISSRDSSAEELMNIAREHWKIESMHWMLDVTFSEDSSRFMNENAHKTLNAMRKYALAIHKHFITKTRKRSSIKQSMLSCLINTKNLRKVLENS